MDVRERDERLDRGREIGVSWLWVKDLVKGLIDEFSRVAIGHEGFGKMRSFMRKMLGG